MKWIQQDMMTYKEAKDYIDTAVIPLVPFQLSQGQELKKNAFQREVLNLFAGEIERDLAGRVLLIPEFTYLKTSDRQVEGERLSSWCEEIQKQPFNHIFFITFDPAWKKHEQALAGTLIWLPAMATDSMQTSETHQMIRGQAQEMGELIRSYW
ncbi:YpiF family protein [Lentibacillus sediminis]|uniref:YpiF family protein n=1 Tax=Lentibacillus sediminis TaxID=1940529 RepID=UPI000C1C226A|nr:YpiF family protein [Lentibacillus sediminis]